MAYVCAVVVAALAATASGGPATAASCPPNLAGGLTSTGSASQLITVEAPGYASSSGSLRLWQKAGGCWVAAGGPWRVRLGRNGLSDHHVEGDGTTPTGAYGLGPVIYGLAPDPGVRYPYHRLVCGDWWNENPRTAALQHLPARPLRHHAELRALRGLRALALEARVPALRPDPVQHRPRRAGPGLGDLPARRLGPRDARLHHARAIAADDRPALAPARREAADRDRHEGRAEALLVTSWCTCCVDLLAAPGPTLSRGYGRREPGPKSLTRESRANAQDAIARPRRADHGGDHRNARRRRRRQRRRKERS